MLATFNGYGEVIAEIHRHKDSAISVPALSSLLRVKATTLNARLRRGQAAVRSVGRTHYLPYNLALQLAELHKYALVGWPTLQEASNLTHVKPGTLKARCEKGLLEAHLDLTKRLRINPAEIQELHIRGRNHQPVKPEQPPHRQNGARFADRVQGTLSRKKNGAPRPANLFAEATVTEDQSANLRQATRSAQRILLAPKPFALPPPRDPRIVVLTKRDYGLPELETETSPEKPELSESKRKRSGSLNYDPERPFSVSGCVVGKSVRYGEYQGTIIGIIDDPFSPRIQVRFPQHQHPLMREVLLAVAKRLA